MKSLFLCISALLFSVYEYSLNTYQGLYYGQTGDLGFTCKFYADFTSNDKVIIYCYQKVKKETFYFNQDTLSRFNENIYKGVFYTLSTVNDRLLLTTEQTINPWGVIKTNLAPKEAKRIELDRLKRTIFQKWE